MTLKLLAAACAAILPVFIKQEKIVVKTMNDNRFVILVINSIGVRYKSCKKFTCSAAYSFASTHRSF